MSQMQIRNPNDLPLIDYRLVKALQGDLKQPRSHEKLRKVLEKRGFDIPLFIWFDKSETPYLMDGHQRQEVMLENDYNDNGSYEVPYIKIEAATKKDAMAKLLEITSQYGTVTAEGLAKYLEMAELPVAETMEMVSFDALDGLGGDKKKEMKEDNAPEVNEKDPPISVQGGVYQLGAHRIMCGSATSEDDINKLIGEQRIDLLVTDPPYNVDYTGKTKDALKIDNDKMDDGEFLAFLTDANRRVDEHMKAGAAFYIFHADSEGFNFRSSVKETGWMLKQCLIWVKQSMVMGRQDYQWKHEPILYGWKSGSAHAWYSDRKQTTVLNFDRPSRNAEHPTMKPLNILGYLISNSSKEGDLVFDSFLGSGSTLIAAEQLGRVCYGTELDPRYVDVIRRRYWKFINDDNEDGWQEGTPELV